MNNLFKILWKYLLQFLKQKKLRKYLFDLIIVLIDIIIKKLYTVKKWQRKEDQKPEEKVTAELKKGLN